MNYSSGRTSRRAVLAGVGAGMVALAGCLGGDDGADESPTLGEDDASVTLEVYTDFACPGCASYDQQAFDGIVAEYVDTGDVLYEHRDLVVPVDDPGSEQAANAAREVFHDAGNEAFWEYKTLLLSRQDELGGGPSFFGELAEEVGADSDSVASAAENLDHSSAVEDDTTRGQSNGVGGTPGFIVDGTAVDEGETLDERVSAVLSEVDNQLSEE